MIFIILDRKQIFLCLRRETLRVSSKVVCYTNVIRKIVQGCAEMPWRIVSTLCTYYTRCCKGIREGRRYQLCDLVLRGENIMYWKELIWRITQMEVPIQFLLFTAVWFSSDFFILWASVLSSVKWTQYLFSGTSLRMKWNKYTVNCGAFISWQWKYWDANES